MAAPGPRFLPMPDSLYPCFAVTAPGLEALTAGELAALGVTPGPTEPGGVGFDATLRQLYRANLELRTASRVLVRVAEFPARTFPELERKAKRMSWQDFVGPGAAARFKVTSKKSKLYHEAGIAERLLAAVRGERSEVRGKVLAPEAQLTGPTKPGALMRDFAFERWPSFDLGVWRVLKAEAEGRILPGAPAPIVGSDRDEGAIAAARGNAERAGVAGDIIFKAAAISNVSPPPGPAGLLATNPPYGTRVGEKRDLRDLFARFGALVRERWSGWTIAMVSASEMPEREMKLALETRWESSNGGIPIRLLVGT